jgi:preprotein translocase subunit SecA
LMRMFGSDRLKAIMETLKVPEDQPIESGIISKQIEGAQKKVEGHNFDIRRYVLEYDNVMNKHREIMYKKRREILEAWENAKVTSNREQGANKEFPYPDVMTLKERVWEMVAKEIETVIEGKTRTEVEADWDVEEIMEVCNTIFPIPNNLRQNIEKISDKAGTESQDELARAEMKKYLLGLAKDAYDLKEKQIGFPTMRQIERAILLRSIDMLWIEHLDAMQSLREGIGLRGYGQRDPLVEYKREGYRYFEELLANIQKQVVYTIYKVKVEVKKPLPMESAQKMTSGGDSSKTSQSKPKKKEQVGRNDPCPCGSGKKYKKCHGK